MHHITEDTPPDMLAGSMDLSVQLPDGREVNMSVDRSTPMMDLLVHVTTAHKLRPSEYVLQALEMSGGERTLPYKPNTPIGVLDTQRVRVLPKGRAPAPRPPAPSGHQPFESTFRLQVHLPRNQFYVIRVGKHVLLKDVMRRVCEDKNLDPRKYEFRHPADVDKVLDPGRTLNDYEITEVMVVHRDSTHLPQPISTGDIMALQREEERRKVHAKTGGGGGVLNLIFKRGRTSLGSGSVSSDTRSISPTHSDDSRSVTPPAVQPAQMMPPQPSAAISSATAGLEQRPAALGRPKPPQRKRRPAPKPPAQPPVQHQQQRPAVPLQPPAPEKCVPEVPSKLEGGLTICHSRNSSDSSGYHEASILSDNCNTTLPRRPKSTVISTNLADSIVSIDKSAEHARSTGNLTNMTAQSKSTTSLTTAGRKKRAPPPPPALKSARSAVNISTASTLAPVVASEPSVECPDVTSSAIITTGSENLPRPKPRAKPPAPVPLPRKTVDTTENTKSSDILNSQDTEESASRVRKDSKFDTIGRKRGFQIGKSLFSIDDDNASPAALTASDHQQISSNTSERTLSTPNSNVDVDENYDLEIENIDMFNSKDSSRDLDDKSLKQYYRTEVLAEIHDLEQNKIYSEMLSASVSDSNASLPHSQSLPSIRKESGVPAFLDSNRKVKKWGIHDKVAAESSFSTCKNDGTSRAWVVGDSSDADSNYTTSPRESVNQPEINDVQTPKIAANPIISSASEATELQDSSLSLTDPAPSKVTEKLITPAPPQLKIVPKVETPKSELVKEDKVQNLTSATVPDIVATTVDKSSEETAEVPSVNSKTKSVEEKAEAEDSNDLETEWQYQLPSPPTAFRDSSPTNFTDITNYDTITLNGLSTDSVITSPSLYQKLEYIKDARSGSETLSEDGCSADSVKSQVLTSKYLSVETLEKRKSLVLERELSSLKSTDTEQKPAKSDLDLLKSQRDSLLTEIEEVIQNNKQGKSTNLSRTNSQSREKVLLSATDSVLPNFKITTYDQPKGKINIFEDDSVRSNAENKSTDSAKRNSLEINSYSMSNVDEPVNNKNSVISASMDNVHLANDKFADDYLFKKPQNLPKYKQHCSVTNINNTDEKHNDSVLRSESFSSRKNGFSRPCPVKRSKSHISLDKYRDENKTNAESNEEGLHKSSSLFNVSGLQSLEVMRMILPKLENSPPNTPSETKAEKPPVSAPKLPETNALSPPRTTPESKEPIKKYQYSGPPAINLSTWSDRPKCQVSLKEDTDYKISNVNNTKALFHFQNHVNATASELKSKPQKFNTQCYPSVNIRVNGVESKDLTDSGSKLNIKINSEPAKSISHQSSGNVIIKIGNGDENTDDVTKTEPKFRENNFYTRFINQTTAAGYRRPLGNVNGVDKPRPHSIAFDASCPDLSRVPIVRAVELKKPFKDSQGNKSITQIIHNNVSDNPDTTKTVANGNCKHPYEDYQNGTSGKSNTLGNQYRHSSVYLSSENLNKNEPNNQNKILSLFAKPVSRGNSFALNRTGNAPTVKGFRIPVNKELNSDSKVSWNSSCGQYNTLPSKTNSSAHPNSIENSVPFSQSTLRRTENNRPADKFLTNSHHSIESVTNGKVAPPYQNSVNSAPNKMVNGSANAFVPAPPQMPKVTAVTKKPRQRQVDPRDQLLESIRNFGGRAGLRAVK